ncbi:MAG TPA: lipid II flippase MurJ [Microlunatus sp.]
MSASAPDRVGGSRSGFAQVAAGVAALTLASRIVGFGRWLVFSKTVGDTCLGDAYNSANQLPNVLFEIAAGGILASVVVPVISRQLAQDKGRIANRTASALLCWTLIVLTPFAIGAMLLAPVYARTFVQSRCSGAVDVAASLLVIFGPQIWLYGLAVVSAGVLQAHRRFVAAAAAPLASSAVVITTYLVFAQVADPAGRDDPARLQSTALAVLGWGTTAGVLVLALVTLVPLLRMRLGLRPTLRFPAGVPRVVISMAGAGLAGLVMQQLSVMTGMFATKQSMIAGAWTRATWASAVYLLPYAVLIYPLHQLIFPRLGAAAARGRAEVDRVLAAIAPVLVTLAALGAGLLIAVSIPVSRLLVLGPGSGDAMTLAVPIICYAPAVIGFALMGLATRTLFAEHRARAAGITTAVAWATVIIAIVVITALVPADWVVAGIAAANSIGMIAGAVVGWLMINGAAAADSTARGAATAAPDSTAPSRRMLRPMLIDIPAALLVGVAVCWGGRFLLDADLLGSVLGAIGTALACIVGYGLLILLLDRTSVKSLLALRGGSS